MFANEPNLGGPPPARYALIPSVVTDSGPNANDVTKAVPKTTDLSDIDDGIDFLLDATLMMTVRAA